MGVEGDAGAPCAELMPHDEVRGRDHPGRFHGVSRYRMRLDYEAQRLQEGAGAIGVGDTVSWRVVRGHPDEFGQEPCFACEMTLHGLLDVAVDCGWRWAHELGLKLRRKCLNAAAAIPASASLRDSAG